MSRPIAIAALVVAALGIALANTPGPTSPPDNSVTDRKVAPDAGIQRSKLAASTPYAVVVDSDAGFPLDTVAPGASGAALVSNGTTWIGNGLVGITSGGTNANLNGQSGALMMFGGTGVIATTLPYDVGGTGTMSLTNHGAVVAGSSALATVAPSSSGNVLTSNGTDWTSATNTPNSLASGDLGGFYPSPNVEAIQGVSVSAFTPTTAQIMIYDGINSWQYRAMTGDGVMDANADLTVTSLSHISSGILGVTHGGTGISSLTAHGLLVGEGTLPVAGLTACGSGQIPIGQAGADPVCETIDTDATLVASGNLTLATVNANTGAWGSANAVPTFTVNGKGLVTAASNTSIAIAASQVTSGLATIATSGALTDGTGTLLVSHGGTSLATLTAHALQVGNGTSAPTQLGLGTTTTLLHGAAAGDPTWAAVSLTADVTGALPATNGGTGADTHATSGYPVLASGTWSFNNAATTLAALGGAATGGEAGAWGAVDGGNLTTTGAGSMVGSHTPIAAAKFRYTTCDLGGPGTVGIGSSTTIKVKIRDITASSDVCSMTMMLCNSTTTTTVDCSGTATAGHTYSMQITDDGGCATPAQFLFCNIGMQQP